MIRYSITLEELGQIIEAEKQDWLVRANERTRKFASLGYYEESSNIWSEVKKVYINIQNNKCAYCERLLESVEYGSVEHDMEHFRPKKKSKPWELSKDLIDAGVILTAPINGNSDPGYHLLAYNPFNYCASCKTCNSNLKRDFFPIEGIRNTNGNDPVQMDSEKPLLIYPIGNFDDDPSSLIQFIGFSPFACGNTEYRKHRALVTIKFFRLDDFRRKNIFRERAHVISEIFSYSSILEGATDSEFKDIYEKLINIRLHPSSAHSNCALSFSVLYKQDKNEAKRIFKLVSEYLESISK